MRKKSLTALKKFKGICYRVSTKNKWHGRYDRCYWFSIKDPVTKITFKKKCGWASEGWTPEAAQEERKVMLEQMNSSSLSNTKSLKYQSLTFDAYMKEYYLPWADENKTMSYEDHSRYRCWLKATLGRKLLKDISSFDIERIKNKMKKAGRADGTIRHTIGLVRPLSVTMILGSAWLSESLSCTRTIRATDIEVSTSMAGHFRLRSFTTVKVRNRLPSLKLSATRSIDQRSLGLDGSATSPVL